MSRLLIFNYLLLLIATSNNSYAHNYVLFGERQLTDSIPSVYFDKNGNPYPNHFIPDSVLAECNGSLESFYSKYPEEFKKIAYNYRCNFNTYSSNHVSILNDSILANVANAINNAYDKNTPLIFIIHGFRKSFTNKPGVYTSVIDYDIFIHSWSNLSHKKTGFVRVFWDGTYGEFKMNTKAMKNIFPLFLQAQQNADAVGLGLRKLLLNIPHYDISIFAHSLGGKVATAALFNTQSNNIQTPSNPTINIVLIAPAIAGLNVFKYYYCRNTSYPFEQHDNYRLYILYNCKDFVLKKKDFIIELFGPGPLKHGATTLGCNYKNEAIKTKTFFKSHFKQSPITLINMTKMLKKCHHLRCYCANNNLNELNHQMHFNNTNPQTTIN
jgi:hypothetical protein